MAENRARNRRVSRRRREEDEDAEVLPPAKRAVAAPSEKGAAVGADAPQLSEAQGEMTVQLYLDDTCDRLAKRVLEAAEATTSKLRAEFDEYKRLLETALAEKHADSKEAESSEARAVDQVVNVKLEVQAGPYAGQSWELKPRKRKVCKFGRSTGKAFTSGGVSLPKDLEVSTTHGKIHVKDGLIAFTDLGSTNGTEINGKAVKEGVATPLCSGDKLLIGATAFTVTLVDVK
mmetsp:Transcript_15439/g.36425  ORF Transcript_15439/g.36425 Transcript_15439/m.36425 type:complete len:232 (-) Transcript_15439:95-790(-)